MIRDLESIQHHTERENIWQMLLDHRDFENVCRYTLTEVKRYADHLRRLSWTTNIGAPQFMQWFNLTEKSIIEFFAGSTTRADKVEQWELKHKSAVQKCQRLLKKPSGVVAIPPNFPGFLFLTGVPHV